MRHPWYKNTTLVTVNIRNMLKFSLESSNSERGERDRWKPITAVAIEDGYQDIRRTNASAPPRYRVNQFWKTPVPSDISEMHFLIKERQIQI